MKHTLLIILVVALILGASFLTTAGIVKLASMAFNFKFTWLKAIVIWLIWISIGGIAKSSD